MNGHPDTTEQARPRIVMCPKCHRRFETMRRFQMACTECVYEWDEASKLSAGERFSRFLGVAGEYLFVWSWKGAAPARA